MNFQNRVWNLTKQIPKGRVCTYKEIGKEYYRILFIKNETYVYNPLKIITKQTLYNSKKINNYANRVWSNPILWSNNNSYFVSYHYLGSALFWHPSSQRLWSKQDYGSLCIDFCHAGYLVYKDHNQQQTDLDGDHCQWTWYSCSTSTSIHLLCTKE